MLEPDSFVSVESDSEELNRSLVYPSPKLLNIQKLSTRYCQAKVQRLAQHAQPLSVTQLAKLIMIKTEVKPGDASSKLRLHFER